MILDCNKDSYRFPRRWLESNKKEPNLNEWKILHLFYYFKNKAARKGEENFAFGSVMLEKDHRIQKIFGKDITKEKLEIFLGESASIRKYRDMNDSNPSEANNKKIIYFPAQFPDNELYILIPDFFIAPPMALLDSIAAKNFEIPGRFSRSHLCKIFVAFVAQLSNEGWDSSVELNIDLEELEKILGKTNIVRPLTNYTQYLRDIGIISDAEISKRRIFYKFTFEKYIENELLIPEIRLLKDESLKEYGSILRRIILKIPHYYDEEKHPADDDPQNVLSKVPFDELLWIIGTIKCEALRDASSFMAKLENQINQGRVLHQNNAGKILEDCNVSVALRAMIEGSALFRRIPSSKSIQNQIMQQLLEKSGISGNLRCEKIYSGKMKSYCRNKCSERFTVFRASRIYIFPIFEELRGCAPFRIRLKIDFEHDDKLHHCITRQIYSYSEKAQFSPVIRLDVEHSGGLVLKVKCSPGVQHLLLKLWLLFDESAKLSP